jgi:hypothetical protein
LEKSRIVLLTWVIPPGLGDFHAQVQAASILRQSFPSVQIDLATLIHEEAKIPFYPCHVVRFKGLKNEEIEPICFPLSFLREADLILQLPTFYPKTEKMLEELRAMPSEKPMPRYEFLGEYGWSGQPNFSQCMGLKSTEKGIFIKEVKQRKKRPNFNLAYTRTYQGIYLYLHALLQALESNSQDLEVAFFDMKHLLECLPKLLPHSRWGIKAVHIHFKQYFTEIPLAEEGKTLKLYHKENLSHEEFLKLLSETDALFGCTGDGSISEAISSHSMYFIDPLEHKIAFVQDLLALAQKEEPDVAEWISLMIPNHFPLETRGNRLGELLLDQKTISAITRLSRHIRNHHSVEKPLCDLVMRALTYAAHPEREFFDSIHEGI